MQVRHRSMVLVSVLSLIGWTACTTQTPSMPAAPALVSAPVSAIEINGLPGSLRVGQSVQLTTSVTLTDGAKKLASDVSWKSSDNAVATISASGVLTVAGHGGADITASAYQRDASVRLRVPFVVTGVVHESVPTEGVALAGARVEIQGGPAAGKVVTTDGEGRFTLEVEGAGFTLLVSKGGYDPASSPVASLLRDQDQSIALMPAFAVVREVLEGTLDPECQATPGPGSVSRDLEFAVHHSGSVTLEEFQLGGFDRGVALFRGQDLIYGIGGITDRRADAVRGGFRYRFRIHAIICASNSKRYRLVFTHPT